MPTSARSEYNNACDERRTDEGIGPYAADNDGTPRTTRVILLLIRSAAAAQNEGQCVIRSEINRVLRTRGKRLKICAGNSAGGSLNRRFKLSFWGSDPSAAGGR